MIKIHLAKAWGEAQGTWTGDVCSLPEEALAQWRGPLRLIVVPYSGKIRCYALGHRLEDSSASPVAYRLKPHISQKEYRSLCARVHEDIVAGRYYQINLLRFFDVDGPVDFDGLCAVARHRGGDFSCVIEDGEWLMGSMSPERFVHGRFADGTWDLRTYPVKGTTAAGLRDGDNLKNQSELNIIVDLMRNDLNRIAIRGSVRVYQVGEKLEAFALSHRFAEIGALAPESLRFQDLVTAMCPAGSITGAPKIEVMNAIAELETESRGTMMGQCFLIDPEHKTIESSVLIRTLVKENGQTRYAAGSGLGVLSQADEEWAETEAKCAVMTGYDDQDGTSC